jgi:sulfur carrier protein
VPPRPSAEEPNRGTNGTLALHVNGEPFEAPFPCTVAQLLARLELAGRRVAVAVEREVVPRSSFDTHQLAAGDQIEILEAVGGG